MPSEPGEDNEVIRRMLFTVSPKDQSQSKNAAVETIEYNTYFYC